VVWRLARSQVRAISAALDSLCLICGVVGVVGTAKWYCKYIRREIRNLYEDDREAFFAAAEVLYKLPESVGSC
jgi:hypothetical protein